MWRVSDDMKIGCPGTRRPPGLDDLPETLGQHLPNTLEEGEAFGTDFKICSCPNLGGKT